jgi:hypothetical protein
MGGSVMHNLSNDGLNILYQKVSTTEPGNLDLGLKNVYWAVDGVRTVGEIAKEDMYEPEHLEEQLRKLLRLGLILPTKDIKSVDKSVFVFLSKLLTDQLGPMGDVVLDDAINELGYDRNSFPSTRLPKLIDLLSQEVGDPGKADKFVQMVAEKLKTVG